MTLSERIAAAESCAVADCQRHREADSLFCRQHLADMWANRLERRTDGRFVYVGPAWRAVAKELSR